VNSGHCRTLSLILNLTHKPQILKQNELNHGDRDAPHHVDGPSCVQPTGALFLEDLLQTLPVVFVQIFVALGSVKLHATLHSVQRVAEGLGKQEGQGRGTETDQEFIEEKVVITFVEFRLVGIQKVVKTFKRSH